jgi:hypothetical protein
MRDRSQSEQLFVSRQIDVFRIANRDHDLSIKRLALLASIPKTTLGTWARGEAAMPAWALFELAEHIPDDITSILCEGSKKYIGSTDRGDSDLTALAREAAGFTSDLLDAEADGRLSPQEKGKLKERARRVASRALAVVAE